MRQYQKALERHLADYKRRRLGVQRSGEFKRKNTIVSHPHILPKDLYLLNILEPFRDEFRLFRASHGIKLHKDFHHLNSSQALAFNLFLPFFQDGTKACERLLRALDVPGTVDDWRFEHVVDKSERTNVDVSWHDPEAGWTLCEVKLSEREFGAAKADARHRRKFDRIYAPRLRTQVDERFLQFDAFVAHYQLLRNVSLLTRPGVARLVFLLPQQNEGPQVALRAVLDAMAPPLRARIHVSYLESVLSSLAGDPGLGGSLREHARQLTEKYVLAAEGRTMAPRRDT
jgi:hypothetical protein